MAERVSLVPALIRAYRLDRHFRVLNDPRMASSSDLKRFHSVQYVDALRRGANGSARADDEASLNTLTDDTPLFPNLWLYVLAQCGATLAAAEQLIAESLATDGARRAVAVCWEGGRHHARRDGAAGFCYANDVVLGIMSLLDRFERVLYIDIDIHHGDGVERAFQCSDKVMTLSIHKRASGFYPGTGDVTDVGTGPGKYFAVNVPLRDGCGDARYCDVFERVAEAARAAFRPSAVVLQCGADGLAGDPIGAGFSLTPAAYVACVRRVVSWNLPTLVLGGGGYNAPNAARCWAQVMADLAGVELADRIPEHDFFDSYGPDFLLRAPPRVRPDLNDEGYVSSVVGAALEGVARAGQQLWGPDAPCPPGLAGPPPPEPRALASPVPAADLEALGDRSDTPSLPLDPLPPPPPPPPPVSFGPPP
eukprot:tig00000197_g15688.t1